MSSAVQERKPLILIAEDNQKSLQVLAAILRRENYRIAVARNGRQALEMIAEALPDLVLLDVMMPEMDGYEACRRMKEMPGARDIPVIFITAMANTEDIVEGFKTGAVDYVVKPFSSKELLVRIRTQLELKFSKDEVMRMNRQLSEANRLLEKELAEAADYAASMLPFPLTEKKPLVDWRFRPCSLLGGDFFSYHWIDDTHFAFYLLDVCGHGVGAALLGVSVMNLLRYRGLKKTDYLDPAAVLGQLNNHFKRKKSRDMFFSIWYGIYDSAENTLVYSSAGHPPAILLNGPTRERAEIKKLRTPSVAIGVTRDYKYANNCVPLDDFNTLFLYSDGAFEIEKKSDGEMWRLNEWILVVVDYVLSENKENLDYFLNYVRQLHGKANLDDDFSLMMLRF
ncbi:MAG: response regulator [bacterium]|nr:response regulator [bacterium]